MLPWLREKIALRRQRWLRSRNEEIRPQESEQQDDTRIDSEQQTTSTKELLFLRIIAPRFNSISIFNLQVSYFDSGLQVKEKLLKKLESSQSPSRSSNDIHSFRLVRSSTKQNFRDYDSILNCNVRNMEEFILSIKRADGNLNRLLSIQNCHGPSEKEILNKTKNFPLIRSTILNDNMSLNSAFLQGDLQHDLRKILSEIAKYSAYIIGSLPFAEKLIKYYRQKILHNLNNHQDIVKILMDMGFSQKNVLRALKLQGNNYTLALDWLVENVNKEDEEVLNEVDEGQSNLNLELSNESNDNSEETGSDNAYKKLYTKTFSSSNSIFYPKHKAISIKDRVEGLLEIVRYYSEKNEEPSTKADTINSLINMGFAMDEIQQALQLSNNSQTAACEWLLEHSSNSQNFNALRESIFVESHILKILLSTPQIQFSLSSPKFFIAYCSLLENYSSLNIFFNDLESQSLLQFILRTYHEEKIYFHTFDKLSVVVPQSSSSSSS